MIDTLCDAAGEAREDNMAVACFYFHFAAQKEEQTAASMLGALLKQVVGVYEQIPKEIRDAFEKKKKVIGGLKLGLAEIVKLLGSLSSFRRTFFCLDALDECVPGDRVQILRSLGDILKMSPTTRLLITGRPHVGSEMERHLPGGVVLVSISPQKNEIIQYIHAKLVEDTTPDEMDEELEAEIVKMIPASVPEM